MCYFIPYFMQYFSYCKIKKMYLSTFFTEICLFSSFAFRFSLVNYFFAFSLLVFRTIVLL